MGTQNEVKSLILSKSSPLIFSRTMNKILVYENKQDNHIAIMTNNNHQIELLSEGSVTKIYLNGIAKTLEYSIGIECPVEKFTFLKSTFRIDTTGRFIYLLPMGKDTECAYWIDTLELELQPDMHNADANMAGGIIIE